MWDHHLLPLRIGNLPALGLGRALRISGFRVGFGVLLSQVLGVGLDVLFGFSWMLVLVVLRLLASCGV